MLYKDKREWLDKHEYAITAYYASIGIHNEFWQSNEGSHVMYGKLFDRVKKELYMICEKIDKQ